MMNVETLSAEWQRIDVLGRCLINERQGRLVPEHVKLRLKSLQDIIGRIRKQSPWKDLIQTKNLQTMDQDILACVIAPEAEPRLGWLYQELQPGINGTYPSAALIRELLYMDSKEVSDLYSRITNDAPLVKSGLIECKSNETFSPLKPGKKATEFLLGINDNTQPPCTIEITSPENWDDLILPEYCLSALKEFHNWINYRDQIVTEWGGNITGGPIALFSGSSGTGKTYASRVLAHAIGWKIYRVDYGMLVSKYVGETEKNLNMLFDTANNKKMVLLFDEAESLFGKRAETRDARDRYANMEISHLLSRIETHNGPCILTSNLQQQLDPAFARRFQFVVQFPRPDSNARTQLWQKHLPPNAPVDSEVDLERLGEVINFTGGQIRNAALQASFIAIAESGVITLNSIARAVWTEMCKEGREVMPSNMGYLSEHLYTGS